MHRYMVHLMYIDYGTLVKYILFVPSEAECRDIWSTSTSFTLTMDHWSSIFSLFQLCICCIYCPTCCACTQGPNLGMLDLAHLPPWYCSCLETKPSLELERILSHTFRLPILICSIFVFMFSCIMTNLFLQVECSNEVSKPYSGSKYPTVPLTMLDT